MRTFDQRVMWPGYELQGLNQTYNSFLHSSQNESTGEMDYLVEEEPELRDEAHLIMSANTQFQGLNQMLDRGHKGFIRSSITPAGV